MKIAGIVLIVLEVLAMLSMLITTGSPVPLPSGSVNLNSIAEVIGFLLPLIIGVILLIRANLKAR